MIPDPCMYITRFAHRMDFGDKTHDVCVAAMRLVSRMKRDWIHTGRRPSGLCGAALLVAARLHGFTCTLKDVVKVVRIGHDTIRKRLSEFVSTPSSQLTINEFMNIDLESEADPPAFTESRLKQKHANLEAFTEEIGELSNAIDMELNQSIEKKPKSIISPLSVTRAESPSDEIDPELRVSADFVHTENPEALALRMKSEKNPKPHENQLAIQGPSPTPYSLGLKSTAEENFEPSAAPSGETEHESDGELDLTNIDDEEIDNMILSQNESIIKTRIWMAENGEFLKEMEIRAEKRRLEEEERERTRPKKKRKNVSKKEYYGESRTAGEAIEKLLHRQKLSNKINYEALKKVTEEPQTNIPKIGSKFIESFSVLEKYDIATKVEQNPPEGDAEPVVKIEETETKVKMKPKVIPCLNPSAREEVKAEEVDKVTIETGPVAMGDEDDVYDEVDEEDSCMSASQLMQKAGVGDTSYGGFGYEGFDEYD